LVSRGLSDKLERFISQEVWLFTGLELPGVVHPTLQRKRTLEKNRIQ